MRTPFLYELVTTRTEYNLIQSIRIDVLSAYSSCDTRYAILHGAHDFFPEHIHSVQRAQRV